MPERIPIQFSSCHRSVADPINGLHYRLDKYDVMEGDLIRGVTSLWV